jgi:A/G-specific adenine glycosylase
MSGRTGELPTPRPKKAIPIRRATWLVLRHREQVLLERRASSGLWGGLLVFPEYAGESPEQYCRSQFSCELTGHETMTPLSHGFTHFRLEISPLLCEVKARAPQVESSGRQWLKVPEAVEAAVPVPVRTLLRRL